MIAMAILQTGRVLLQRLVRGALSLILAISGGAVAVAAPPADHSYVVSLRRLTEREYRNSIADIFGKEIEVRGSFEPTIRSSGLAAVSTASLSVTPVGFESFNKMANDIAAQVTAEKNRSKLPCTPKDPKTPDDACARKVISHYGLLLFRRPLTEAELDNRVGLSRRCLDETLLDSARAAGARIDRGRSVRAADPGARTIRTDDGEEIGADALLLATGKHELRGAARPRDTSRDPVGLRTALSPSKELDRVLDGVIELHLFDGGYAGLLLQEDGCANLCLSVQRWRLKGDTAHENFQG